VGFVNIAEIVYPCISLWFFTMHARWCGLENVHTLKH
jgi:hypothetical protein